jgi:hypothetical protein
LLLRLSLLFANLIPDPGLNKLNEAADAAALANDGELLSNVRAKAKDQATIDYIDALAVKAGFQPSSGR